MKRSELILNNQNRMSRLRKWAYSKQYQEKFGLKEATALAKDFAKDYENSIHYGFFAVPTIAIVTAVGGVVSGAVAAGAFVAAPLLAVKAADDLGRLELDKMAARAMLRLSDKAQTIFRRFTDKLAAVPENLIKTRDLAEGIAKIKHQTDSMMGVGGKKGFDPLKNIYLPASQIDKGSPLFAQNKFIYDEIMSLKKAGLISSTDIAALEAATNSLIKISGEPKYDRYTNYAVLLPQLEKVLDKYIKVQTDRESIRVSAPRAEREKTPRKVSDEEMIASAKRSLAESEETAKKLREVIASWEATYTAAGIKNNSPITEIPEKIEDVKDEVEPINTIEEETADQRPTYQVGDIVSPVDRRNFGKVVHVEDDGSVIVEFTNKEKNTQAEKSYKPEALINKTLERENQMKAIAATAPKGVSITDAVNSISKNKPTTNQKIN